MQKGKVPFVQKGMVPVGAICDLAGTAARSPLVVVHINGERAEPAGRDEDLS